MALTIPTNFKFQPPNQQHKFLQTPLEITTFRITRTIRRPHTSCFPANHCRVNPKRFLSQIILTRACSDGGGGELYATPESSISSDVEALRSSASGASDSYAALFVRMLGLDNSPLDREQAIIALWKFSLGGKKYIDSIMQFHGSINLTVNLLKSESSSTCEAAAGLLRMISSINVYRELVAESGAIEELTSLLRRCSLNSDVLEQGICTLWNLSVDEKLRVKIANSDILHLLIKFLDKDEVKVKEAAGGVLANLALSHSVHKVMVEAGVIPKLAKILITDAEGSKVTKKEARNVLLELSKDEYYRILVMEEGLVLVPLIGTASYKSFKPTVHSWPSLPDGTKIEQTSKGPSKYGASELLLGLNIQDKNANLEEKTINAMVGRARQKFLARIGAIEIEDGNNSTSEFSSGQGFTLLPWIDGVARLVLIIALEDESAIARAAESIADASINQQMRVSFQEAGAVKHLVQLVNHHNEAVVSAVIRALERLSISNDVCLKIEAEGALYPLVNSLKSRDVSDGLMELILDILARILDPSKEMKSKVYDGPVNGSMKGWSATSSSTISAGNDDMVHQLSLTSSSQKVDMGDLLDSSAFGRFIEILKIAPPNLQRKALSIIEFATAHESCVEKIISADIESGLVATFKQKILNDKVSDIEGHQPEPSALEVEEAGLAISAASRLLARLLDFEQFQRKLNSAHFTKLLRKILMSSIHFQNKEWVAACLVKFSFLSGSNLHSENEINIEVTLYETIPRLIEQIKDSLSPEVQEAAVIELNRIICEGIVDATRAVATAGGIFPLVKLIENGSGRAVDAGLAILYNLSMDSENHSAILAAGAVPVLRRIILSQRPQWTRALHLLRTLPT